MIFPSVSEHDLHRATHHNLHQLNRLLTCSKPDNMTQMFENLRHIYTAFHSIWTINYLLKWWLFHNVAGGFSFWVQMVSTTLGRIRHLRPSHSVLDLWQTKQPWIIRRFLSWGVGGGITVGKSFIIPVPGLLHNYYYLFGASYLSFLFFIFFLFRGVGVLLLEFFNLNWRRIWGEIPYIKQSAVWSL